MRYINSFKSEWLKTRHSLASWLTLIGGLLVPVLFLCWRLLHASQMLLDNTDPHFWEQYYREQWQQMAIFVLPMGTVLVTSLVTQMENMNNAWKQVNITPQPLWMIYCNKLLIMLLMLAACIVLFIVAAYVTGMLPALFFKGVPYPVTPFPLWQVVKGGGPFYVACLPILTLQYVISLLSRNYLVSIGAGLVGWFANILGLHWQYGFVIPYIYVSQVYLNRMHIPFNNYWLVAGYTVLFSLLGLGIYLFKKQKGA